MALLQNTGVCVVPGSGFGQEEGVLHHIYFSPDSLLCLCIIHHIWYLHDLIRCVMVYMSLSPDLFCAITQGTCRFTLLDTYLICSAGTYHFRTTILPSEEKMQGVMERMALFHAQYLKQNL